MTNEDAIRDLKKLRAFHNGSYGKACNMAIEALEKQIPIKPNKHTLQARWENGDEMASCTYYLCPRCGDYLRNGYNCRCNQAIDWSRLE